MALPGPSVPSGWQALGVASPGQVRLSPDARARLTHLTELNDIDSPAAALRWAGALAREPFLVTDLRRVRPWLSEATAGGTDTSGPRAQASAVMTSLLHAEWTGFLALLGEYGPWVYVPSVADLQTVSRAYGALVEQASRATDGVALDSAQRLAQAFPGSVSLLARLEATDYRRVNPRSRRPPAPDATTLTHLEAAVWQAAASIAERRREDWARQTGSDRRR